jgi:hypothetical protein
MPIPLPELRAASVAAPAATNSAPGEAIPTS